MPNLAMARMVTAASEVTEIEFHRDGTKTVTHHGQSRAMTPDEFRPWLTLIKSRLDERQESEQACIAT